MGRLFGTDGVRGVANDELTADLAYKLGQAGAYVLTGDKKHKPKILVGRDTRISGQMLESALIAGICSVGAEAIVLGVVPTPAVAYLTRKYKADAGIVISASHNPVEYNGIKFFNSNGYKLRDELEDEIEDIIINRIHDIPTPTGRDIGTVTKCESAIDDYIAFVKGCIGVTLDGIKVAIDCANGALSNIAERALKELGANVSVMHSRPDGININEQCGSTYMNDLMEYVKSNNIDLGLAFDGDADRCLAVDELGNMVDGDQIMAICAKFMKQKGTLKRDTIVVTVMSNLGLHIMAQDNNIEIKTTQVGDRYVLEKMLEEDYSIGGEQSGHIIFLDENTTGDGLLTALHLLEIIKIENKEISQLANVMKILPQVLKNAKVDNNKKYAYKEDTIIVDEIINIEKKFEGKGRVLIRPSGTEPLIRVMLEGSNERELNEEASRLASIIEKRLNNNVS